MITEPERPITSADILDAIEAERGAFANYSVGGLSAKPRPRFAFPVLDEDVASPASNEG